MSEKNTVEKAQDQLMALAVAWLARWSGQDPGALLKYLPGADGQKLEPYRRLLGTSWEPTKPGSPLLSIFSRVRDPQGKVEPEPRYWLPQALSLEKVAEPTEETTVPQATLASWWRDFEQEAADLLNRPAGAAVRFEMFTHLLHKWTWAVPCSYGEPGVSFYDEFRALSALVHASGCAEQPDSEFLLVAGDIPGIQDFVYTITSKGAAKGLRGRSFFIQILGDAVVRRILAEMGLPETNVIYAAGGNFMLLAQSASARVNGEAMEDKLARIQQEIDTALLSGFEGDLSICLAWTGLRADQLGNHGFADPVSKELKRLIADRKRQRFSTICEQQWKALFGPRGEPGNRYCVICQRPLSRGEGIPMVDEVALPQEEHARRCSVCDGFQKLAESLGGPGLFATGLRRPHTKGEAWQEALWQVGRTWFAFGSYTELAQLSESSLYTVNDTNFLRSNAQGFRFIANATPRVSDADIEGWHKEPEEGEEPPHKGGIRTFSQMADVATGVKRLGVLRMDVDNLGQIMVHGLNTRTMATTSALSQALDRFFSGWLNPICKQVNESHTPERGDRIYVVYAGGDDLFAVGPWDLTPLLAGQIQQYFAAYVGHNPNVHISAGITLEDRKFPLYQAAKRAGSAEEAAKKHIRGGTEKDAINFLDLSVKWDEWVQQVLPRWKVIVELIDQQKVPKALIRVLRDIYAQHEDQIKRQNEALQQQGEPLPDEPMYQIYYGPWMWREAYALTRLVKRLEDKSAKDAVLKLQVAILSPVAVRAIGLAARWAELLTREERE